MKFGGFQRSSLIEYPDKVSAVVFTLGCNFRCPFCQNYQLVIPEHFPKKLYDEKEILEYLKKRKGLLDALSITGGEPTIHGEQLLEFMRKVKNLGYLVQLETNGSNPKFLKKVINEKLVDYLAMDIKAPFEKYPIVTGVPNLDISLISESISIVMNSGVEYEFRTTLHPLLSINDFKKIAQMIKGAKVYYLQKYENENVLDSKLKNQNPFTYKDALKIKEIVKPYVKTVFIRGFV